MRYLLLVVFIGSMVAAATAQTKVLTNSDLEKYRLEREKAEREYRENYAKKGFPSPEELDKRRRQNEIENQEYVIRLNEQIRAAENAAAQRRTSYVYYTYAPTEAGEQVVNYPYLWSYGRGFNTPARTVTTQPGYFAGGQFWPTPVRTPTPVLIHPAVRMPPKPPRKNPK